MGRTTTEVDGETSEIVFDGLTGEPQTPLITVPLEDLVHALALKNTEWKRAKTEYSKAGTCVKTLGDQRDAIVAELIRRDEQANADPSLPFDDVLEDEDE